MDQEYSYFMTKIRGLTGIDLKQYKSKQMHRRIRSLMQRSACDNLVTYYKLLEKDEMALRKFRDFITINVSEFFRNPDKFQEIQTKVLPALIKDRKDLRIWSAGCSNGAEPYSLSIILDELVPTSASSILATDIDDTIITRAKTGIYTSQDVKNVSKGRIIKYFNKDVKADSYELKPHIRSRVDFRVHNLLKDTFPSDMDLILCRNVVIYFTDEAKETLYRNFYKSLRPGGILFVGGTESILNAKRLGYTTLASFFYQKPVEA